MKRKTKPIPAPLSTAKGEVDGWRRVLTHSVNHASMLCYGKDESGACCDRSKDGASPGILRDRTFFHLVGRLVSLTDADYIALVQVANYRRRFRDRRCAVLHPV
jgi:hypothetical protein